MAVREFLVGTYALCDHLTAQGIRATVVEADADERIEKGFFRRDLGYVKVEGRTFSMVAIRLGGTMSLHPSNWSHRMSVGPVPLSTKDVHPVQYHFVVAKDPSSHPASFEAKLRLETRGFFDRTVDAVRWEGRRMAEVLNADRTLRGDLQGCIRPDEGLRLVADESARIVRIALKGKLVFGFNLLSENLVHLDRGLPNARMVDVIERIAAKVSAG